MKKIVYACVCLLFGLMTILPLGMLASAVCGYTFELTSVSVFSVITMVISVLTVIFNTISKDKITDKGTTLLLYTLTLLSFFNAVISIFESGRILVVVCVLVSFVCMFFLMKRSIKTKAHKTVVSILYALMTAFILFFAFIMLLFSNIGQNTVIKNIESPNGNYYAQVIDSDQGALGGRTIVDVYEKRDIDVFVFKLRDTPQRVYVGEWREYESMHISWKDDNYLVVDSVEYEIK